MYIKRSQNPIRDSLTKSYTFASLAGLGHLEFGIWRMFLPDLFVSGAPWLRHELLLFHRNPGGLDVNFLQLARPLGCFKSGGRLV